MIPGSEGWPEALRGLRTYFYQEHRLCSRSGHLDSSCLDVDSRWGC